MKYYIIEITTKYTAKGGEVKTLTSYYEKTIGKLFRFNCLVGGKSAAKVYTKKVLAQHDAKRLFRPGSWKVVAYWTN